MSGTIPPREEIEVFVNKGGNISIRQDGFRQRQEDPIVEVAPEDVPKLIELLEQAAADAAEFVPEPEGS